MGMTMTQKILAAHAGLDHVVAGQLIEAKLDVVMANDITGPMALPIFRQMAEKVFDKDKVVLVPDHFTPNKDIKSAENSKSIREFAKDQGLSWYFEQGKSGVEHAILPEAGVVAAGECIRCRFTYLYIWSTGCIFYRCRNNGYCNRYGNRRTLVQSAKCIKICPERTAGTLCER